MNWSEAKKLIDAESARKYKGSERDSINDVAYLCAKIIRHSANLQIGKVNDPDSGVPEHWKIKWYQQQIERILTK